MDNFYRKLHPHNSSFGLLAFPPPYKAWLTICNDPDHTTLENWQQLHQLIWEELKLPLGDSFFIHSFNDQFKNQLNLTSNKDFIKAHLYDTIHTWGDYMFSRSKLFDRADALAGIQLLKDHNINPLVWTDHAKFQGNMLHNSNLGSIPSIEDAAGYEYENNFYSLDLVSELGIRYIWDGKLVNYLGQDTPVSEVQWYKHCHSSRIKAYSKSLLDIIGKPLWRRLSLSQFTYAQNENYQYFPNQFPDGRTLYCFKRFGSWQDADIDGLGNLIKKENIDQLIERQGTCIVYTHLGKRKAHRFDEDEHIPLNTRQGFVYLKERHDNKQIMVSPTSHLLDYLIIRDNMKIDDNTCRIDFCPDGIRFKELNKEILSKFQFGLFNKGSDKITVTIDGDECKTQVKQLDNDNYLLMV